MEYVQTLLDGTFGLPPSSNVASLRYQIIVQFEDEDPIRSFAGYAQSLNGRFENAVFSPTGVLAPYIGPALLYSFPASGPASKLLDALNALPGVRYAELDPLVTASFSSNDPIYLNGSLWGMYGPDGDGIGPASGAFGSYADVAWANAAVSADGHVGSMRTVVGVIDTGVDPTHPDLYLNIWINQNEIPSGLASDRDGDGVITFRDLNARSGNAYLNAVSDINTNGYIDADDILRDRRWADGRDQDGNGFTDDLFGWDFYGDDNRPFESYEPVPSRPWYAWPNWQPADKEPSIGYHGTHVSGTIGAVANGAGLVGIAWEVQIMPLRFLGPTGSGSTSDAVRALDYYTEQGQAHPNLNFVATNNSWSGGGYSQTLDNAIAAAGNFGHLFVAAAGNDAANNDSSTTYPANYQISSTYNEIVYDPVISVAAIDKTGALASFSNFGAGSVDLGAPGVEIASTFSGTEQYGYYTYVYASGTSMAAPHVTGALALVSGEITGLHPAELRQALLGTATPTSSLAGRTVSGGRLNVADFYASFAISKPPSVTISVADSFLSLKDGSTTVTFAFSTEVEGFDAADVSVSTGHGSIIGLTSLDNKTWTALFTPMDVETSTAQISVGSGYTDLSGTVGTGGKSALFAIDRIVPTAQVSNITGHQDGSDVLVFGNLTEPLGDGEILAVYRDGEFVGNAGVSGADWSHVDASVQPEGSYIYTARAIDSSGNEGKLSGDASIIVDLTAPTTIITSISANRVASGIEVAGTISVDLGADEVVAVYRDETYLGAANISGTDWSIVDSTSLVDGQYAYTARLLDAAGNAGVRSVEAILQLDNVAPTVAVTLADMALALANGSTIVTFAFSEKVKGFDAADVAVTSGHGSVANFATSDNTTWTATFTPADIETSAARITVGTGYSDLADNDGQAGQSGLFSIDRVAPLAKVLSIAVSEQAGGTAVTGTLSAILGVDEVLNVYRDGSPIGTARLSDKSWIFLDAASLAPGVYEYTAIAIDAAGNTGSISNMAMYELIPAFSGDFWLTPGVLEGRDWGNGFNGTSDADSQITAGFRGTGNDLVLSLTGYDIDTSNEVQVLLNGALLGNLRTTPNNGTGVSSFMIAAEDQLAGQNVLSFVNNSGFWFFRPTWGLTDILLENTSSATSTHLAGWQDELGDVITFSGISM